VKLTADLYGKKVEYNGTVAGLGVGTGAAFSLLPAQNATGNWIKVVQRVPVRIALDPEQLKANTRCASACRWTPRSTSRKRTARRWPMRRAPPRSGADAGVRQQDDADAEVRRVIAPTSGATRRPAAVPPALVRRRAPSSRAPPRPSRAARYRWPVARR
jgi:membrane fusion protein (multidrug efflux system)